MLIDWVLPKISKHLIGDMIETKTTLVTTGLDVYFFFKTECYIMKKVDTSSVRNIKRGFVV